MSTAADNFARRHVDKFWSVSLNAFLEWYYLIVKILVLIVIKMNIRVFL
jgi:hypothetical protein